MYACTLQEEDSMLANTERMQGVATAEDGAKQAKEDLQKLS